MQSLVLYQKLVTDLIGLQMQKAINYIIMHHLESKAYLFLIFKREEKMHPMQSNQTPFGPKFIYHLVVKFGRWVTMNKITQIKRKNYSEHI